MQWFGKDASILSASPAVSCTQLQPCKAASGTRNIPAMPVQQTTIATAGITDTVGGSLAPIGNKA